MDNEIDRNESILLLKTKNLRQSAFNEILICFININKETHSEIVEIFFAVYERSKDTV